MNGNRKIIIGIVVTVVIGVAGAMWARMDGIEERKADALTVELRDQNLVDRMEVLNEKVSDIKDQTNKISDTLQRLEIEVSRQNGGRP